MKKIFITGARGMLGIAVSDAFSRGSDVMATDLPECDITDRKGITARISEYSPDVVIHLASMTDVDACELDPEAAERVNRIGTRNVALACRDSSSMMVYVSTGMIYNGRKSSPYIEYDRPDPISVYGRTKFEGELEIRGILDRYLIVNTCWIFGGGSVDKKFVPRILQLARERSELSVVDDNFGSPTYTRDLAAALAGLVEAGARGRYHCVNSGCVNRFEMASAILEAAGIDDCVLSRIPSSSFDLPAARPPMEAMGGYRMALDGMPAMRGWREALSEYVQSELI